MRLLLRDDLCVDEEQSFQPEAFARPANPGIAVALASGDRRRCLAKSCEQKAQIQDPSFTVPSAPPVGCDLYINLERSRPEAGKLSIGKTCLIPLNQFMAKEKYFSLICPIHCSQNAIIEYRVKIKETKARPTGRAFFVAVFGGCNGEIRDFQDLQGARRVGGGAICGGSLAARL